MTLVPCMTAAGHKVYTGILLGFAVVAVVFLCKVTRRTSYGKYTSGHDIYANYMACWTFATDVVLLTGDPDRRVCRLAPHKFTVYSNSSIFEIESDQQQVFNNTGMCFGKVKGR